MRLIRIIKGGREVTAAESAGRVTTILATLETTARLMRAETDLRLLLRDPSIHPGELAKLKLAVEVLSEVRVNKA